MPERVARREPQAQRVAVRLTAGLGVIRTAKALPDARVPNDI